MNSFRDLLAATYSNASSNELELLLGKEEYLFQLPKRQNDKNSDLEISCIEEEMYGYLQKVKNDRDEMLVDQNKKANLLQFKIDNELDTIKLSSIEEEISTLKEKYSNEFKDSDTEIRNVERSRNNLPVCNNNLDSVFKSQSQKIERHELKPYNTHNSAEIEFQCRDREYANSLRRKAKILFDRLKSEREGVQKLKNIVFQSELPILNKNFTKKSNPAFDGKENSIAMIVDSNAADVNNESFELLRRDDETYALRRKKMEMLEMVTNAQISNEKLKSEQGRLLEDLADYKQKLFETLHDTKISIRSSYQLEDDNTNLKKTIDQLEVEVEKLRVEMIEKILAANGVKRELINIETSLEHFSNAYERKRKEAKQLNKNIEDSECVLTKFRNRWKQFITLMGK